MPDSETPQSSWRWKYKIYVWVGWPLVRSMGIVLKYSIGAGAIAGYLLVTPAFAVGLTEADFNYLTAMDVQSDGMVIRGLSPKEQSRLHVLINDLTTAKDPIARAKDVSEALAEFKKHQEWEIENPGKFWDEPKRQIPN
jgi:hypothetical protein